MSDLRDEIARAVAETTDLPGTWDRFPDERAGWLLTADAVLRVVGERLAQDDIARIMGPMLYGAYYAPDETSEGTDAAAIRLALSAAWRVVTGSNHE